MEQRHCDNLLKLNCFLRVKYRNSNYSKMRLGMLVVIELFQAFVFPQGVSTTSY